MKERRDNRPEIAADAMDDPKMTESAKADLIAWLRQKEAAKRPALTVGDFTRLK